jgi:hypothetical protein
MNRIRTRTIRTRIRTAALPTGSSLKLYFAAAALLLALLAIPHFT